MQIINDAQETVLRRFPKVPESEQFYLVGGTALSLFYLKHRRSNDLDFFTAAEELIDPFSRRLEERLRTDDGMEVQRQRGFRSFVELTVQKGKETTLIHLAQDAPFRFKSTVVFPGYPNLRVENLEDLAAGKFLALFGRATLRDFIDIYALIQGGHFRPEELIERAKKKDPGFDLYWLGVAFERIKTFQRDAPELLMLLQPVPFQELSGFFDRWRKELSKDLTS